MENTVKLENRQIELPKLKEWGDSSWRGKAACAGYATSDFFPEKAGAISSSQVSKCKVICYGCTVRTECLNFAMRNFISHGVWGGLSVMDRRNISIDQIEEATRLTVRVVVRHLIRSRIPNKVAELALIAGVPEQEAELMLKNPNDSFI